MRKFLLLIALLVLCASAAALAEEYQMPDNFNALMDTTYNVLYRSVKVDAKLSYDVFLFDNYCLALSALTRGQVASMSYNQIKEYYQESLDRYHPESNLLLMISISDPTTITDIANFPKHISIVNSKKEVIYGQEVENYGDAVFVVGFPMDKVNELLAKDKKITIQINSRPNKTNTITYDKNYQSKIPAEVCKLVKLFEIRDPKPAETGENGQGDGSAAPTQNASQSTTQPATQPANQSATQPTTEPATQPANPAPTPTQPAGGSGNQSGAGATTPVGGGDTAQPAPVQKP